MNPAMGTASVQAGNQCTAKTSQPAATVMPATARRAFPTWLVLAVLLGFMSVSYFDCTHGDYAEIVADRPHLIRKSQEQASSMLNYLAIAVTAYGFVLILFLWARAKPMRTAARRPEPPARPKPPPPLRPLRAKQGKSGLAGALGGDDTS